jgi:2-polyprenyl-3-methyl-5-hydroxy-6-metoxy-1,4-benzoquinol methylase
LVSVEDRVREHFHADAERFDAIYDEAASPIRRWIDQVWRGVVRRRLELTVDRLEPLRAKTILDVGCGSGRFCFAFAQRGAARVVGIDFAPAMIELANRYARELNVDDRCEFRTGGFPDAVPEGGFDATTAMGFFDYIENPVPVLAAMRAKTRGLLIASFPKAIEWRVPVRRVRFWLMGCPLYLYTDGRIRQLLGAAGLTDYDWVALDRDVIIVARVGASGLGAPPPPPSDQTVAR